ncbi:hypothetical protein HELRODRAFT_103959 [Helobdella robusta]|uniref:Very-long-chain (3R)-3-hydroxyacyl-CoA dehydratase n=1 Tax=Helobdella robusta TaxID=6412 RepID=T1EDI8_HELRO|nr:hypothetical protein HELRODRAFT_103959 [Helobdella robusta]ESN92109.1 hypothetical protein HELRODRAFT_103959 [Helobdella robusta]
MSSTAGSALLKPFVHWGQNKQFVFVRVEIAEIEDSPTIEILEEKLNFKAYGLGVTGMNFYGFSLDLYHNINILKSKYKITARGVEIELKKVGGDDENGACEKWPRLTHTPKKLFWLKTDFDRFAFDSSDESSENEANSGNGFNEFGDGYYKNANKEMVDRFHRQFKEADSETSSFDTRKHLKTIYLMLYNLFQWIGYVYIFSMLLVKLYLEGPESRKAAFKTFGPQMMVCQSIAVLEIFHSLLRWVKSSLVTTSLQVLGRGFVLFVVILPESKLHERDVVWCLFLTWSAVEIVRYPYYMLTILKREVGLITWLRYTVWIPLYPLGFIFEGTVMLISLPLFEESKKFTYPLPNPLNISFYFTIFLQLYMLLMLPGSYFLMQRMYEQRKKKLNENSDNKKTSIGKKTK